MSIAKVLTGKKNLFFFDLTEYYWNKNMIFFWLILYFGAVYCAPETIEQFNNCKKWRIFFFSQKNRIFKI